MLKKIEDILSKCIEDIKAGRSSIEDCLGKYSSIRKQLEPLLRIAIEIQESPDVKPSPAFKVRARVQLMEQIYAKQSVIKWPWVRYINQVKPIPYKRGFNMVRFKMAAIFVAVTLVVFALGGGTVYASQYSLPGGVLYPVKLGTEQARLFVAANNVDRAELYLTFANSRVGEMKALAERERPEKINLAVNGYDEAIGMTIEKMDEARGKGLDIGGVAELVGEATSKHLSVLDEVYDSVPDEAKEAINMAREVSMTGQENALEALARENPVRAMEINLAAMESRLNRAKDKAGENEIEEVENALHQFEELSQFGDEISLIAQELGEGTSVYQLVASATTIHLEILALVYEKVPEQAKEAIKQAIEESIRGYERAVEALEEAGALGGIPDELSIPVGIPDEIKKGPKDELIPPEKGSR